MKLDSGNILYYKGRDNETLDGVGFFISKKYADKNKTVHKNVSPHENEEIEAFYDLVTETLSNFKYT